MTMRETDSVELKSQLDEWIDIAQRQPVVIRSGSQRIAALVSMEDYEKLRALQIRELQNLCDQVGREAKARGMNEAILEELLKQ